MKKHITQKDRTNAAKLVNSMMPVEGEKRVVYKCADCRRLFGRRFIPFGMGSGLTVNACMCQLTAHRNSVLVLESVP